MLSSRPVLTLSALIIFLLSLFFFGFRPPSYYLTRPGVISSEFPDFGRFRSLETLHPEQFPLYDVDRRVIIVGDIHGMFEQFQRLLAKISYNPSSDVLISVGDIVAKGPHSGSMQVLDLMASHNVTAVRGNHDQQVIEWRTWIEWVHSLPGGSRWLSTANERWRKAQRHGADDVDKWVAEQVKHDRRHSQWWKRIPKKWTLFGDHYKIAEEMTDEQYVYMVQRPLRIHVPHAHTFIVHAGILASDPEYPSGHKRQPLAHIPPLPEDNQSLDKSDKISILRRLQEQAILSDVPQNTVPWNTLNMRGILSDHSVTRKQEGTPWAELYNKNMKRCAGFDAKEKSSLPCYSSTVIYGHAASRGLDINRWSIGLDSGCVYKRHMSALVLGGKLAQQSLTSDLEDRFDEEAIDIDGRIVSSKIQFGDSGRGKLYRVTCK
ncbi:hypothetical protein GYMLUDRAFT_41342 [Collybiopsis luxurians FD-317 M1]|uniref:Calcineurin-like phosphoesterase domain-containing protein n=1 Tax=Collybiopsis luxurians FD-317 M1 TaxID=944289 RepID=A0A0D0D1L1_9AGAR|nr:hypothetical protein GYMLUDRAFT_41342 [Collybiopsis luxurians FD-317 M1]